MWGGNMRHVMIAGLAAAICCAGATAAQAGAIVQTIGSPFAAHAGGKGASVGNSAMILVQVNHDDTGLPSSNLGANAGNGTAVIALPPAFQLFSNAPVPAGACLLSPTEFTNWGNGTYVIRVAPFPSNPACGWLSGKYGFVVHVSDNGKIVGSGVGDFVVP